MEPQKFGRYEIKAEIGRGGMATVYQAYDPRFEREVAIKVLPREMLHDPQFRTRFEREAKTVAMLEHPAIVPVYDFGEEEGQPYFVMRYMTGGSLSDRMKKGPFSIQEAALILAHIASALDEAHAKGIIHRDLKPGNILFDQYNEPYVSDFGIAKLSEAQTNFTGSAIVGTPAYMSPEQAQGEGIDGRSDIYGIGVILFEMLTGQQPYHGDTPMSVVVKHITDPVPRILDVKPDLPPYIAIVVEKALAKDPNERFQTVRSMAEALEAVARGESPELELADVTIVASSKTATSKRPTSLPSATVVAKRAPQPENRAQVRGPATLLKRSGVWIGLGAVVLLICVVAVGAVVILKDKIPFLAGPIPTRTEAVLQGSSTLEILTATNTPSIPNTPTAGDTLAPQPTETVPALPALGGADLIAFLSGNNIWTMHMEGTDLQQLTEDNAEKHDLQWSPDGQSLFYISGKCIQTVTVPEGVVASVTCFTAADYLEAFEISPDGSQVVISLNRVLYVVPFNLGKLSKARTWVQLQDMGSCLTYGDLPNQAPTKSVRWSNDGKQIAVDTLSPSGGIRVDLILVFDISTCNSVTPKLLDNFPGSRFEMTGYAKNPVIPSFDWDGGSLFLLNSIFRYQFGYLYVYNTETKRTADLLDPLGTSCCYSDGRWSPDGSYIFFAYQAIGGNTQLYYIPYGSIGTGAQYTSFALPADILSKPGDHPDAVLRPVP